MYKLHAYKNGILFKEIDLDINKEYLVGRSKECDIILDDMTLSRQQFKLFFENESWNAISLSKFSKLIYKNSEEETFKLEDVDSFGIADYKFTITKEAVNQVEELENTNNFEETAPLNRDSSEVEAEEKTFVPQMATNDWSLGLPFIFIKTNDGGSVKIRLEGDYWIAGREDSCEIVIPDGRASREHFEIFKKDHSFFISDKDSSNGTYLNNKKLTPNKECPLKSGDNIVVGSTLMVFEIRDPYYEEKVSLLPVDRNEIPQNYSHQPSPEVYTQKVVKIKSQKNKNYTLLATVFIAAIIVYSFLEQDSSTTTMTSKSSKELPQNKSNFDQLTKDQQEFIEKTHTLAKTLYTQGKYELALTEIEKIEKLLPQYKDSKDIKQFSKNAIDTLLEQKELAKIEEKQKAQEARVSEIISQCEKNYNSSRSLENLNSCLEPALELDPENNRAQKLLDIAEQNQVAKEEALQRATAKRAQIERRRQIFFQAQKLQQSGKVLDAISTYKRHIASTLPDPNNLESESKKQVENLKKRVASDISKLTQEADEAYAKKEYKIAISKMIDAIRLNPQDQSLKDKQAKYSGELFKIVKALYADSVLEENIGNIDSAKEKWKKIKDIDVEYGEYYKKASSKLKKYGL